MMCFATAQHRARRARREPLALRLASPATTGPRQQPRSFGATQPPRAARDVHLQANKARWSVRRTRRSVRRTRRVFRSRSSASEPILSGGDGGGGDGACHLAPRRRRWSSLAPAAAAAAKEEAGSPSECRMHGTGLGANLTAAESAGLPSQSTQVSPRKMTLTLR
jgi:hypothetical protein